MSTTIDQKVVEMRFDNRQFEANVATSMSTLDKLKQKLNLSGSAKSLESINHAAKNIDMRGLGAGVEYVSAKFSALQVMGVTTLANITNSAVNAGKRMASALTLDPIKTGFTEYETQMNAVQTILANTSAKGSTIDDVNEALDTLNTYADKTIYNFTEMTRNIGTFTAAGVDLDTSVSAIQGIANLAAVSGSTSQQASTAMYQLSQALASGTVKLQDWNSVVNAGMGGEVFQNALKRTAKTMGINVDAMIKEYGSFRESLSRGQWLTTEVLTTTLNQFTMAAQVGSDEWNEFKKALKDDGYTEEQAVEILKMANTATDAATKVKTFSQLWDVMKESAQSGWSQTWKLIIGDFEEAKALLTPIADVFTGIIGKMSEARNKLLESALSKSFKKLADTVKTIKAPIEGASESIEKIAEAVKDYDKIVTEIIRGNWGNGKSRYDALTKAGYDWAHAQNLVNERLGSSVRHATNYNEAQESINNATKEGKKANSHYIASLAKMEDQQLRDIGITEDQIKALRELEETSDKLGISLRDLVANADKIDGRWLLIESFKNMGRAIAKVFETIKDAWRDTFKAISPDQLFDVIAGFHKFTTQLIMSNDSADKLTRAFKGVFAILDIVKTIAGGGVTLAFKTLGKILDALDTDFLSLAASIGDAISRFRDFLFNNDVINKGFELIATGVDKAIEAIDKFIDTIKNNPVVQEFVEQFSEIFGNLFGDVDTSDATSVASDIKEVSDALSVSESAASNFGKIVEGVLAGFDLSWSLASKSLMGGLNILNAVFKLLGTNIPDILAWVADWIIKLNDWVDTETIFGSSTKWSDIATILVSVGEGIAKCVESFIALKPVQEFVNNIHESVKKLFGSFADGTHILSLEGIVSRIESFFESINEWINSLQSSENIGRDVVLGIAKGIGSAIGTIVEAIKNVAMTIMEVFCDILKIFSPSRVFFEYGMNIVQGLSDGINALLDLADQAISFLGEKLKGAFENLNLDIDLSRIFEAVTTIYTNFIAMVKSFDFKKLLTLIPIAVVLIFVKKLYDLTTIIGNGIVGVNKVIGGLANVENSLAGVLNAYAKDIKSKSIQRVAISIAILVGSIIALTYVNQDNLMRAVVSVSILAGVLFALAFAMNKMGSSSAKFEKGKGFNVEGLKTGIIAIGAAILLIAGAVKLLSTMNQDEAAVGFLGLAVIIGAMAIVLATFGKIVKGDAAANINQLGKMLVKMAIAMALMVGVVKLASLLEPDEMKKGAIFAAGFVTFVMLLSAAARIAGHTKGLGKMVLGITIAMALMVGVVKLISLLKPEEMLKGAAFALGFVTFVGILSLVAKGKPGAKMQKIGGLVLSMSIALGLMVGVIKLISLLKPEEMLKGAAFALGFLVFVGILVQVTKIGSGKQIAKVSATILAMSIAIGVLAGICILLGLVDESALKRGVAAVTMLGLVMTAMITATRGASDIKGSVMMMAVAIGIMAAAIVVLSLIKPDKLAGATAALSIVMGMFAVMLKAANGLQSSIGTLVVLVVAVGILAGAIYLLSGIPVQNALGVAASLSILLISLAASMKIMNNVSAISGKAMLSVVFLTAIIVALAGILYLIQGINPSSAIGNAAALSTLLISMSVACKLLSKIKIVSLDAMLAIVLLTGIVALLAGVLYLVQDMNPKEALGNAVAISTLLISLSAACLILTAVGAFGPAGLIGVGVLATMIVGIGGLMVAIGALMDKFPKLEEFLNKGIPILEKVGYGIGSFFGNIVGGFTSGVTSGLPDIATDLSTFMDNLSGFIAGAKNVGEDALTGVKNIVEMIALISGGAILEKLSSWITGDSSMGTFSANLSSFGEAIVGFSNKVKGNIDEASITAAASAGKMLAEMQSMTQGTGGVVQFFTGEKDLSTFGDQLIAFGDAIVGFSDHVKGRVDEEAVSAAASAGTLMTELQSKVEPTSGVVQWFCGEKDMTKFGEQLLGFGTAIVAFSETVSGADINEEAVTAAANAGAIMAELQSKVEPVGGVVDFFAGTSDLATFGTQIAAFGAAIVAFSSTVAGNVDEEAVTAAANAGAIMATLQESIPEDKWFDGKVSLEDFGAKIQAFGEKIKAYSEEVTGIDSAAISASLVSTDRIVSITGKISDLGDVDYDNFKPKKIGSALKDYSDKVSDLDNGAISSSITTVNRLVSMINNMAGINTSGVGSFTTAMGGLAKTNIDGFADSFNKSASSLASVGSNMVNSLSQGVMAQSGAMTTAAMSVVSNLGKSISSHGGQFMTLGTQLMTYLISGIMASGSRAASAMIMPLASAVSAARGYYYSFYSAGSYLVTGFVNGIAFNAYRASIQSRAMALAAKRAAEQALGIKSPSRVFMKIGAYLVEGFANGITDNMSAASNAATTLANTATKGFSNAISTINDYLSGNMDMQPTIRPVLDLSEVSAGASTLNSLLNMGSTIGLSPNAGVINTMMGRNQNGTNADVVSAINKLRSDLGNIGNTTYHVDGITYDDGSNIATAVKDIVRATKMEGRI